MVALLDFPLPVSTLLGCVLTANREGQKMPSNAVIAPRHNPGPPMSHCSWLAPLWYTCQFVGIAWETMLHITEGEGSAEAAIWDQVWERLRKSVLFLVGQTGCQDTTRPWWGPGLGIWVKLGIGLAWRLQRLKPKVIGKLKFRQTVLQTQMPIPVEENLGSSTENQA